METKEIKKDLGDAQAIDAMLTSQGGVLLMKSLSSDIVGTMETLAMKYPTLTMQEFVSLCSDLKVKLDIIRMLTRAKKNKKYLESLLVEEDEL